MLFGYPAAAIEDNWFHDCLVKILQTIHSCLRDQKPLPEWPQIIPETYRESLSNRRGLRDRLIAYQDVAATLNEEELTQVATTVEKQNNVRNLLSGDEDCEKINGLPERIHQPVKNLFEFSFKLLTDLGIRDRQYQIIYEQIPNHICPFCGCEYFDAPTGPREALDHFLADSIYPFAAANLCNLVPMGHKCNSKYKHAQDILHDTKGARRKSFYPYEDRNLEIILINSIPFEGANGLLPRWQIDFNPESEEVLTWDTVFHIRERYERDIFNSDFNSWLREFSVWCAYAVAVPQTNQDVVDAINRYMHYLKTLRMRDRAFLKAAVFRMLLHHCKLGHQRLLGVMDGLVKSGMRL